jgi:hypothetical protein
MELKNLQNQIYPIPYLELEFPFFYFLDNRKNLPRFENIANDENVRLELYREIEYFIEFAFSYVGRIIWFIPFLKRLQDNNASVGRNELLKFSYTVIEAVSGKKC